LLDIIAKNTQQKSPAFEINGREIVQPFIWYTCPAGKIARVKGTVICTGFGAASQPRFSVAGVIKYRWGNTINIGSNVATWNEGDNEGQNATLLFFPPVNTERKFDVTLSAGQTIETSQNSGTNSEFNLFAEVVEKPV